MVKPIPVFSTDSVWKKVIKNLKVRPLFFIYFFQFRCFLQTLFHEQIANQNETGLVVFDPEQGKGTITTGFKVTLSLIVMLIIFYMGNVNNSFRQFKYKIITIGGFMKSRANSGQLPANGYMPLSVDDKEDVFRL